MYAPKEGWVSGSPQEKCAELSGRGGTCWMGGISHKLRGEGGHANWRKQLDGGPKARTGRVCLKKAVLFISLLHNAWLSCPTVGTEYSRSLAGYPCPSLLPHPPQALPCFFWARLSTRGDGTAYSFCAPPHHLLESKLRLSGRAANLTVSRTGSWAPLPVTP